MGVSHSSCLAADLCFITIADSSKLKIKSNSNSHSSSFSIVKPHFHTFTKSIRPHSFSTRTLPFKCGDQIVMETRKDGILERPSFNLDDIKEDLVEKMVYDALVWCSLYGLVVGDKNVERSGKVPGVGLVHAPFALLPTLFPESYWRQACDVAPIFNELFDRVSLDGQFLQDSLSRTKQADAFTSRLLNIHSKMLEMNKKEEIRLGLHRSDYMLDEQTKLLLQIEFNTISSSFSGLSCLVSALHRSLLSQYGETLELDSQKVPSNNATSQFAEALAKAWIEYNNPRAVIVVVVQTEERNMYDQHWLSTVLGEKYNIKMIRKTLADIDAKGKLLADGTLLIDDVPVAVVYFRAGYTPNDYPSESEWSGRLLMEKSSAVKCPSISYHLAGTKKIQQELAKPHVLERFLDNKEDIAKVQKCFAGLWSLDDPDIVNKAIENPELFVMKPQREGGGNNIYGEDVKKALLRLRNEGTQEDAAYILMQRIFPAESPTYTIRDGICHRNHTISELGVYSAYLRNEDKIIMNEECGYLMRTKISSSNEGGVVAGFGVLDSIYLT